jgi:hypothetical protein
MPIFPNPSDQAIYDALSPKNKAHVEFVASLKELDHSGLLVSTLNPYSYDIEVIPVYTTVRHSKWRFFSKMVTTTRWQWVYKKLDRQGVVVEAVMDVSDISELDARHQAYKLVQKDAILFNQAKLREISEMDD